MKKPLFAFLIFTSCASFCQNRKIDSLLQSLSSSKEDTLAVKNLNKVCYYFLTLNNHDSSLLFSKKAEILARKLGFKKGLAQAYNLAANNYHYTGNYPEALRNGLLALNIDEEIQDKKAMASCYNNLGLVHYYQNNLKEALKYHQKALALKKELGDMEGLANSYGNLGNLFSEQGDLTEALKNHEAALKIQLELGDSLGMANSYSNIGIVFELEGTHANNRGDIITAEKKWNEALKNYFIALRLRRALNDKEGIVASLVYIGGEYNFLKNYGEAEKFCLEGMVLAKEIEDLEKLKEVNLYLSNTFEQTGRYKEAYAYFRRHIAFRDSLFNEENTKKTTRLEMNYEFEKREAAERLEQEKKEAVSVAESNKQRIIIWSVCGVLLLVLGFALFAYRSYLQKQKANVAISAQKHIIEEKQKEILDSIHYASRIQRALLASEMYISNQLNRLRNN